MHIWPQLAHEFPDIHFRLHLGHLYSPKQRFRPWYGVRPESVATGVMFEIDQSEMEKWPSWIAEEKNNVLLKEEEAINTATMKRTN